MYKVQCEEGSKTKRMKGANKREQKDKELVPKTVLFVDQSPDGGLARMMREVLRNL